MGINKIFSIALALSLSLTFLGCSEDSDEGNSTTTDETVVETPNTTVTEESTVIDVNGTTIVVLTSYNLNFTAEDGVNTMELDKTKAVSFYVENSQGDKISDSDLTSLSITLMSPNLGELRDIDNNTGDTLSYTTNNVSVTIESNTVSGILPIEVNATFIDSNGDTKTLRDVFGITILSGPPTAMDIEYDGTSYDGVRFNERLVITLTDKHSNKVNNQPTASASMISNYALETLGDQTTRLFIETTNGKAATMSPTANILKSSANFTNISAFDDFAITYGRGYFYNVSGKWDISAVSSDGAGGTDDELALIDTIQADSDVSNIGFAVGNNDRWEMCRDSEHTVSTITMESDKFDENGQIAVNISYGNYMVGKTVAIGIDTIGYTANGDITSKFGTIEKHTLRSTGFTSTTCEVAAGASVTCDILVTIEDSNQFLRNSGIAYDMVITDDLVVTRTTGINDNIYSCANHGGISYERFTLDNTAAAADAKGVLTLTNITTRVEF